MHMTLLLVLLVGRIFLPSRQHQTVSMFVSLARSYILDGHVYALRIHSLLFTVTAHVALDTVRMRSSFRSHSEVIVALPRTQRGKADNKHEENQPIIGLPLITFYLRCI